MKRVPDCIPPLERLGVSTEDAYAMRRIAMTLRVWHERECGTDRGHVERDETTGKPYHVSQGTAFLPPRRWPIPDLEKGALKRLEKIMARYDGKIANHLLAYVQPDPRGAALSIVKASDVPPNGQLESYYTRGVAVYR